MSRYVLRFGALGYLALLLLVPVGFVFYRAFEHGFAHAWDAVTTPEAIHALELTLLVAAIAVPANTVFGIVMALALVRGRFAGRGLLNAVVDLPLALSPVIVGLALVLLYGRGGWLGRPCRPRPEGPVRRPGDGAGDDVRLAARSSCARSCPCCARSAPSRSRRPRRSARVRSRSSAGSRCPAIRWAVAYGVVLTTARAIGEFGAVSAVSGNIEGKTQTLPLYVKAQFDGFDTAGAYASSVVLALIAIATVVSLRVIQPREH